MADVGRLGGPLAFLGVPTLLGWVAVLAAQGFAAYLLGYTVARALRPGGPEAGVARSGMTASTVLESLGGALLLAALLQVPFLGGLLTALALLLAVGAFWLTVRGPRTGPVAAVKGAAQPI